MFNAKAQRHRGRFVGAVTNRTYSFLFFVVNGFFLLTACTRTNPPAPASEIRSISISAPVDTDAGEPISLVVRGDGDGPFFVLATGTFGSVPITGTLNGGAASLTLDSIYSSQAGAVTFFARADNAQAQATTTIRSGPPVDPILPLVGPRSIVADGAHWTMLVAVPIDRYGNPLADGFPVTIRAQHPVPEGEDPLAALEVQTGQVERLFAWVRVYSRTKAGRTFLSVNAGDAASPERDVQEVPGTPVSFALYAVPAVAVADGRQTVEISSDQIRDRFGNLLLDGMNVQLLSDSADGSRRMIPTFTQDGRIYATLQSPDQPGELVLHALIDGVLSEPLSLRFTDGPAVQPFPVAMELTDTYLNLTAGPLLGPIDQFIPDGTTVYFTITDPDGVPIEAEAVAEYGYATLQLRREDLMVGAYRVKAVVGTGLVETGFVARE